MPLMAIRQTKGVMELAAVVTPRYPPTISRRVGRTKYLSLFSGPHLDETGCSAIFCRSCRSGISHAYTRNESRCPKRRPHGIDKVPPTFSGWVPMNNMHQRNSTTWVTWTRANRYPVTIGLSSRRSDFDKWQKFRRWLLFLLTWQS